MKKAIVPIVLCFSFGCNLFAQNILNLEPVCTIDLSQKWNLGYQSNKYPVLSGSSYENTIKHNKQYLYLDFNDKKIAISLTAEFLNSRDRKKNNSFDYGKLFVAECDGFSIYKSVTINEECSWNGTTTIDSTIVFSGQKNLNEDFKITIESTIYSVQKGESEMCIGLFKELIKGITARDYSYWDNKRHFPYSRNYIDSLYNSEINEFFENNEMIVKGILNCNGRARLFDEYSIEENDSIHRLNDVEAINYVLQTQLERNLTILKEQYEPLYENQFCYVQYFGLANQCFNGKLTLSDLLNAIHFPDTSNFLCQYVSYQYPEIFAEKKTTPKSKSYKVSPASLNPYYRRDFRAYFNEFNEDYCELLKSACRIHGSFYGNPYLMNASDETDRTTTFFYWAETDSTPHQHLFSYKLYNKTWKITEISLPFVIDDSLSTNERGKPIFLHTKDYIALNGNKRDSVYFLSTQDPNFHWHGIDMTPPLEDKYILVYSDDNQYDYDGYQGFKKINQYGHLLKKLELNDDLNNYIIDNFKELIHSQNKDIIEKLANDSSHYYQLNDTAFVKWNVYYQAFDTFIHPALKLFVSNVYTGNIDDVDGDEIFAFTASNGKIISIKCYTFRNGKITELKGEALIPMILKSNDVNYFLQKTMGGNYEMTGWSEISKQDTKPSPLIWILASGTLLTGGFLFARRKKYALN
ncbi:MAG: hypothetical protein ACKVOK_16440 [Flavobacteriales bacterium]